MDSTQPLCRSSLWTFIHDLLMKDNMSHIVAWTSRDNFEFRVVDTEGLAKTWGRLKGRSNMTYAKFSRALRYYYRKGVIEKVSKKRFTYRFILSHRTQPILRPNMNCPSSTRRASAVMVEGEIESVTDTTQLTNNEYECNTSLQHNVVYEWPTSGKANQIRTNNCSTFPTTQLSLPQEHNIFSSKQEEIANIKSYLQSGTETALSGLIYPTCANMNEEEYPDMNVQSSCAFSENSSSSSSIFSNVSCQYQASLNQKPMYVQTDMYYSCDDTPMLYNSDSFDAGSICSDSSSNFEPADMSPFVQRNIDINVDHIDVNIFQNSMNQTFTPYSTCSVLQDLFYSHS